MTPFVVFKPGEKQHFIVEQAKNHIDAVQQCVSRDLVSGASECVAHSLRGYNFALQLRLRRECADHI